MSARARTAAFISRSAAGGTDQAGAATPRTLLALLAVVVLGSILLLATAAGATAPILTIGPASGVEYSTATLEGEVDPEGEETSCRFEYITDAAYTANETAAEPLFQGAEVVGCEQSPLNGSSPQPVSAQIGNLAPETKYHQRLVAENLAAETTEATGPTFTTKGPVTAPTVTIAEPPTLVSAADGQIEVKGHIDPSGSDPAFAADWHFSCEPACEGPGGQVPAGGGEDVAGTISSLQPDTPYTITLHASNQGGEAEDTAAPFEFGAAPATVVLEKAVINTGPSVRLRGSVNPHRAAVSDCHFSYGPTAALGSEAPCAPAFPTNGFENPVHADLPALPASTTFHLRLSVTTAGGTVTSEGEFETPPALPNASCPNQSLREEQHATFLSDCRAYEMVSPPDKNGGDVMPYTPRTRASADGDAVSFASLVPFGDAQGTGVAVEHLALRGADGWRSHAITPPQDTGSLKLPTATADTYYDNVFSPDFERGITMAVKPVTEDPNVENVVNLYRRTDLKQAGPGSYDLLTRCPLCAETGEPLPAPPGISSNLRPFLPTLGGASPDIEHVAFESVERLTQDTPEQPASCGTANPFFPPSPRGCAPHAYTWDEGQLHLGGILPNGEAADVSFLGEGARYFEYTPHVVSDGSDGHTRVFFTQPTGEHGETFSEIDPSETVPQLFFLLRAGTLQSGNLFARIDGTHTVWLNESERSSEGADAFAPAKYLDASADGERIFFWTRQALTNDATQGSQKLYMYDLTKPPSDPHNLTLITPPGDAVSSFWGVGGNGNYAYFTGEGQIWLWKLGAVHDIGPDPGGQTTRENWVGNTNYGNLLRQGRVASDGRNLLFSNDNGLAFGDGSDLGACADGFPCHELYLYNAESESTVCVSCPPSGTAATSPGVVSGGVLNGGARVTTYQNRGITDDGSKVFFSSREPLVPQDTNGREDAYEYDVATHTVHLLSSGRGSADSWYLDSSSSGRDVFIGTSQQLVGWDSDKSYDVYDVRAGGGFPEPPPPAPPCSSGECQGPTAAVPAAGTVASGAQGLGNPKHGSPQHCPKGKRKVRRKGNVRCAGKHRKHQRTNDNRRAGR